MGFTTPCFIYKNTLKLQGKLKYLGYVEHPNHKQNITPFMMDREVIKIPDNEINYV